MSVEGNNNSGYIGVDPIYQNYANETERPYVTDDEKKLLIDHGYATDEEIRYGLRPGQTLDEKIKEEDEARKVAESDSDSSDSDKDKGASDKKSTTPVKSAPVKATPPASK
jgi:hypothetical protein